MGAKPRAVGISLALSGFAHTFVILSPRPVEPRSSPRAQSFVELSIEQRAPIERLASAEQAPLRPPPVRFAPRAAVARASANADLRVADQTSVTAAGAAAPTKTLELIPRASLLADGSSEQVERHTHDVTNNDALAAAEHMLNTSLYAAANRPAYRERRAPPVLVAAADGGYDYTARAHTGTVLLFRAHIAKDGTVRFEDGASLQLAPIPISGTFELDDLLRRGERHTAEKRWFLEQTAALRERLAAEALRTTRLRVDPLLR